MDFVIGIAIAIGLGVVLMIILEVKETKQQKQQKQAEKDYYELNYKHANEGMFANTYEEAKKHLTVLEQNYPGDAAISHSISREVFKEDMKDLRKLVGELKKEEKNEWKYTTEYHLNRFKQNYKAAKFATLDDSDKVKTYVKRCLDSWDKYYAMVPPNSTINPKETFLKYMRDVYEQYMDNRVALKERLDSFIAAAAPLQQRKLDFYAEVRNLLQDKGEIYRSELLQTSFEGYSAEEVKICYEAMLKTRRIKEEKRGNRFVVFLNTKKMR